VGAVADPARARARCDRRAAYADALAWIDATGDRSTLRWPDAREAASLRDAATLYEMYCFFALARGIAAALGERVAFRPGVRAGQRVGLARGSEARIGARHALIYNQDVVAYSGTLRPDFVLRVDGVVELVFDAKMRVTACAGAADDHDARATRVDLDKMHAYRDALNVRAAVCVFPGERSAMYRTDGTRADDLRLAALVRKPLDGVGALALTPEGAL
jgi:predicted component of viral defense system (DUF524 family)